jgi:hypothetical protein
VSAPTRDDLADLLAVALDPSAPLVDRRNAVTMLQDALGGLADELRG